MSRERTEEPWPSIKQDERLLYEICFYSQGPLDGYLFGDDVTHFMLQSGLSLEDLSKIWCLADVSKDNMLNVHEFVLAMHLIRGTIGGRLIPATLPRCLMPQNKAQIKLPTLTQSEKNTYQRAFNKLETNLEGIVDVNAQVDMLLATQLPLETLAQIWDLSDIGRDGHLNLEEFTIACHILRYIIYSGGSLNGPIDVFQCLPNSVSPTSLAARKNRIAEYENHKQKMVLLKEKRRTQASQENRRLELTKLRLEYLQELNELFKKHNKEDMKEIILETISKEKVDIEEQEEIVFRVRKVHEEVRQLTVKLILDEQKHKEDIHRIKKKTDELNKRLSTVYTHENQEADPFHQILEQRKDISKSLTDLDIKNIHTPFKFSPFDIKVTPETLPSGTKIIKERSNFKELNGLIDSEHIDLKLFRNKFLEMENESHLENNNARVDIFTEILDWSEQRWSEFDETLKNNTIKVNDAQVYELLQNLSNVRENLKILNSEGRRLVFRNSEDYNARKNSILAENAKNGEKKLIRSQKLRSKSLETSAMLDTRRRYTLSGEMRSRTSKDVEGRTLKDFRFQSLDFNSPSSNDFQKVCHQERKLIRSTTDPMTVLDQASVLKEEMETYTDSGSLHPEEFTDKSLTLKNQKSQRKDNNILTLKSSRRKDDLSLELASIALGRKIHVETIPAPVSTEKAKHSDIRTNKQKTVTDVTTRKSPMRSLTEQENNILSTDGATNNVNKRVIMKSHPPKLSSSTSQSLSTSSSITLSDTPSEGSSIHRFKPVRRPQDVTSSEDDFSVLGSPSLGSFNEESIADSDISLESTSTTLKNFEKFQEFQLETHKPPQLKTQNFSSEDSTSQLSLDHPTKSLLSQGGAQSKRPRTTNTVSTNRDIFESKNNKKEMIDTRFESKTEPTKSRHPPIGHKINSLIRQNSFESPDVVGVYKQRSSFDNHRNYTGNLEHKDTQTDSDNILSVDTLNDREQGLHLIKKINDVCIEKHDEIRYSHMNELPLTSSANCSSAKIRDTPTINYLTENSSDKITSRYSHRLESTIGQQKDSTPNSLNNSSASRDENFPPPLPTSSPPAVHSIGFSDPVDTSTKQLKNHDASSKTTSSAQIMNIQRSNEDVIFSRAPQNYRSSSKCSTNTQVASNVSKVISKNINFPTALQTSPPISKLQTKAHKDYEIKNKYVTDTNTHKRTEYIESMPQHYEKPVSNHNTQVTTAAKNVTADTKTHKRSDSGISVNSTISELCSPLEGLGHITTSQESVQVGGKPLRGSTPGDYGFVYSVERPKPPPEAGWVDKQGDDQKINLYSENVVQEVETTESVDRESIANLITTKKQWEVILNSSQSDNTTKKKAAPKWEVKVPYTEKRIGGVSASTDLNSSDTINFGTNLDGTEDPDMFKKRADTESAIEREIRLAHEREDVLRKEKELRNNQTEKQKGQVIIASYEAESESFHQVYNELAEADRGSDLWSGEHRRRHTEGDKHQDNNKDNAYQNESIIEKEIRLQKERESDVLRMRKLVINDFQHHHNHQQQEKQHSTTDHGTWQEEKDVNHNQPKVVSYEDAISKNSHEGESLIARELRELKEREEELKRSRSSNFASNSSDNIEGSISVNLSSQKVNGVIEHSKKSEKMETSTGQGIWNRDLVSNQRRESLDSTSSHGSAHVHDSTPSRRDVKVRPIVDEHSDEEDIKSNYFEKQETPIEREMRLARERENELRRQKGLPEVEHKDENPYGSYGASHVSINSTTVLRSPGAAPPSDSMKKFASNRLQQEILVQKEREHELRSQGKLISTSEDHIELKKYLEIAGVGQVDGTEKRNFITKKTTSSYIQHDAALGQHDEGLSGKPVSKKISGIAAGGNLFSYKEFKQTAESKIERELRELREREEEYRYVDIEATITKCKHDLV